MRDNVTWRGNAALAVQKRLNRSNAVWDDESGRLVY